MGYGNMSTFGNNSIRVISAAMGNAVYGNAASKSNSGVSTSSQNYNEVVETYDFNNNNYNSQTETIPSNGVSTPNGSKVNPETMRVEPAKEVVPDSFEPGSSKNNGDLLVPADPNSDSNGDSLRPANPNSDNNGDSLGPANPNSDNNGDLLVPTDPKSDNNGDSFGPANPDGGETHPNNGVRPLNPDFQPKTPGGETHPNNGVRPLNPDLHPKTPGETIPNNGVRPLNPDFHPKTPGSSDGILTPNNPGSSDGILTPNNPNLTNTSTSTSTASYFDGNLRDTGIHLERPIPHILGDKK